MMAKILPQKAKQSTFRSASAGITDLFHRTAQASNPSFFMPGADLVQIGYQSMEITGSIDIDELKTGTG
jgi:hypothetical protein